LTFDIDCLDPAYAPGTGTPVSGGPSSAKILSVLQRLHQLDIRGADVVEVSRPTTMPISPPLRGRRSQCICWACMPSDAATASHG
jgi:agmatinase